jgi:hypothetical protein
MNTQPSNTTLNANALDSADPQLPAESKARLHGSLTADDFARKADRKAREAHERNCRDEGGGLGHAGYTDL